MNSLFPLILETEHFEFRDGFEVWNSSSSILSDYVYMPSMGTASMETTVRGMPGTYDMIVFYYDQEFGRARSTVQVDGVTVDSWVWDKQLGSSLASIDIYTSRVIPNVSINDVSTVRVIGERVDQESVRIDKVVLAPLADRASGGPDVAFPGAVGFGSDTAGGRGGWIVKVTNLNDSGPGSLRWALEDLDMPRIVVFEIGGVINLRSQIDVNGDVTVAGQTAPGDGVTIRGARLRVVDDDVIIRGLKFRPGDGPGQDFEMRDAISIGSGRKPVQNVVIDGNSFSWATDEVIDVWHGARNVTISHNIIAEGLRDSRHPDGPHSMGVLIGDGAENITIANNFFISTEFRNPTIAAATNVEIINNYVYNYGQHGLSFTFREEVFTEAHVIGNHFERGPSSGSQKAVRLVGSSDGGKVYLQDNISYDRPDSNLSERAVAGGALLALSDDLLFTPSGVAAMPAHAVKDYVLANAGARGQGLDSTDARLVAEALNGGGSIKDRPPSGAYSIQTSHAPIDSDGDGIPDAFEAAVGGRANVFDPHGDGNGDGYGNIESYINSLIPRDGGFVMAPPLERNGETFRIEAEDFQLVRGFAVADRPIASGGALIESFDDPIAVARHTFGRAEGVYDLSVGYYDQDRGVASMAVRVNGVEIDRWDWDRKGDFSPSAQSLTERTISNVALRAGDVVELRGFRDTGDPVRTDYVDFQFVNDVPRTGDTFRVEAEDFRLVRGFTVGDRPIASGGALIESYSDPIAVARHTFGMADGVYHLSVGYYDQDRGVASMAVRVNGVELDRWDWDRKGDFSPSAQSLTERTISNVTLRAGDVVELRGFRDTGDPVRTDYVDFQFVNDLLM